MQTRYYANRALMAGLGLNSLNSLNSLAVAGRIALLAVWVSVACTRGVEAHADANLGALSKMPVKEVTIFKDGHALVVHEGAMTTDADGNVAMDYVPTPVLGTFWPYVQAGGPKLTSVVSGVRKLSVARTALSIREMIESNTGSQVQVTEIGGKTFSAVDEGIPMRTAAELEETNPPNGGPVLPEKSENVLLRTSAGTLALPLARIQSVAFGGKYHATVTNDEFRNLLTLKLRWPDGKRAAKANVGMMYLQKGLRWIPDYKVSIDGNGTAQISLQATLINEMTDLNDVTANLVIGVPKFYFQDSIDPIALQQTVAQLSNYFNANSPTGYAMSNGIMGQAAGGFGGGARGAARPQQAPAADADPEVTDSARNEDLFVFTVQHITLKKGERMTVPVREMTLKYQDIYSVVLPVNPPREIRVNGSLNEQQQDLIRAANMPKALHNIRLINSSGTPLTTAPALILSRGKVVAQSQMTYTAIGAETDLLLTTAVNFKVTRHDLETSRTPNAENYQGHSFTKIDLAGKISITNYGETPALLEITRSLPGNVISADNGGESSALGAVEDEEQEARDVYAPAWWSWYSWPFAWNHFNRFSTVTWKVHLDPSKSIDLGYKWNYYWQ